MLGKAALQTAIRKRRRPHEPLAGSEEPIFESVAKTDSGDETLKADATEAVEGGGGASAADASANEIKTEESESIKAEEEDGTLPVKDVQPEVKEKAESEAVSPKAEPEAKDETVEKMNTSEDDEVTAGAKPANGDLNGDLKPKLGRKNMAPKPKARAKLSSIIQKLIDGVPARLEQMSKTPMTTAGATGTAAAERSGGGGAGASLNHSLLHKVTGY